MSKQEEFDSPSSVTLYLLTLVHCINNQTRIVFKALYHRTLRFPHTLLTVIISTPSLTFLPRRNSNNSQRFAQFLETKRNEIFINVKDIRRILAFLVSYLGRKSGQIRRLFIPPRPHSHPAYITLTLHCKSTAHARLSHRHRNITDPYLIALHASFGLKIPVAEITLSIKRAVVSFDIGGRETRRGRKKERRKNKKETRQPFLWPAHWMDTRIYLRAA